MNVVFPLSDSAFNDNSGRDRGKADKRNRPARPTTQQDSNNKSRRGSRGNKTTPVRKKG